MARLRKVATVLDVVPAIGHGLLNAAGVVGGPTLKNKAGTLAGGAIGLSGAGKTVGNFKKNYNALMSSGEER